MTVTAGRNIAMTDPLGIPVPRAPSQLVHLMHPTSAAVLGNDIYVLDAGLNGLFRYEMGNDVLVRVAGVPALPGGQVRVLSDHTILVLDPARRRVVRMDRGGRTLRIYADDSNLARPVAMAADEAEQMLFVADGTLPRIVAFRLGSGAGSTIVPVSTERARVHAIGGLAAGDRVLYLVDPIMRQVVVLAHDGTIVRVFGHGDLMRPHGIGVDAQGRVWVLDAPPQALKLFEGGRMAPALGGVAGRLAALADISIGGNVMALADPGSTRVQVMRIVPAGTGTR